MMPIDSMRISFHDAIKNAYMTKVPLVIVEGRDDISVYMDLLKKGGRRFNVKPIQYFKHCSPGCKEIEDRVSEINERYGAEHQVYNSFKGIVDCDAKRFRGEELNKPGLLYLESYSFENSFVTENSILHSIKLLTSLTIEQLNKNLTDKVVELINGQFRDFYYISLEALRNAIEPDYDALVGFSDSYQELLFNPIKKAKMLEKHDELDAFAEQLGINCNSILNMGAFCKGKWHLQFLLKSILRFTEQLYLVCGTELVKCPLCEAGQPNSCLYKQAFKMDISHLTSAIKSNIENADLNYIQVALYKLAV